MASFGETVEITLAAQRDRLILWAPVAFGVGVATYFGLLAEPEAFETVIAVTLALTALTLSWKLRHGRFYIVWLAAIGLSLAVAGFAGAQARTAGLHTILLEKPLKAKTVSGTVRTLDMMEPDEGVRVVLEDPVIEDLPPEKTPKLLRVRVRKAEGFSAGDRVEMLAALNPPSAPVAPGAFDFQRHAYFNETGASGFAYDAPRVVAKNAGTDRLEETLEMLRQAIERRIVAVIPEPASGVAVAFITGDMTAVSAEDAASMRISGLAHMLSISGLHISLVAGVIFFVSRFLMALIEPLALHFPIKKFAAAIAFAGALFYTLLAGSPVPAVRSMIMTGIVLLAVMLDRQALSMRLIALAALIVLVIWPEALWGASFQMSFAAVTALIMAYEAAKPYMEALYRDGGIIKRMILYVGGMCMTTIVASLATAPFSLYHFQQFGIYSLPANLAAEPVMGFIIMPMAVLACFLMPLGLEHWPLWVIGKGVEFIERVSAEIAALPDSSLMIHALPFSVLVFTVAGALLLMFWKGWRGKAVSILPFAAALIVALSYQPPDILVSPNAKLFAVRGEDGKLLISSGVSEKFVAENWRRRNGENPEEKSPVWPKEGPNDANGLICGEGGCTMERGGKKIAFSYAPQTHRDDCALADILIADDPVDIKPCRAGLIIDRFSVWDNGAYAVWLDGRHENVQDVRGTRPWTVSNGR